MMASFFTSAAFQIPRHSDQDPPASPEVPPEPAPSPLRSDRFYDKASSTSIPSDLLEFSQKAFSTTLTREKWSELLQSYPTIKDTDSFLTAPKLEAGMKEALKKQHGHLRTKDVLAFDEGLSEQQVPFVMVARPILAALTALDTPGGEGEDPDPDTIKDYLEDALVLLGNAHVRLNNWRQRRFMDFLTEIGKRTLREGIPTDQHLFPDKFHEKIKNEHDHTSTTKKLISTPAGKPGFRGFSYQPQAQPFRANNQSRGSHGNTRFQRKRSWSRPKTNYNQPKRGRPSNRHTGQPDARGTDQL